MLINNRIVKFAIYFTYHSRRMHYVFKNIRMIILIGFIVHFIERVLGVLKTDKTPTKLPKTYSIS